MLFDGIGLASVIKRNVATEVLRARERTRFEIDLILQGFSVPTSERSLLAKKLYGLTDGIFSALLSGDAGHHSKYLSAIAKEISKVEE